MAEQQTTARMSSPSVAHRYGNPRSSAATSTTHSRSSFARSGSWWPVEPFSAGKRRVRAITIEQRVGGRVHETWDDGTEVDWGQLLAWDPPKRFVMSWSETPLDTEVELSFTVVGPALTRVDVEHRGWDALTEEQLAEDCALPGGYRSGGYAIGWRRILASLTTAVEHVVLATPDSDS